MKQNLMVPNIIFSVVYILFSAHTNMCTNQSNPPLRMLSSNHNQVYENRRSYSGGNFNSRHNILPRLSPSAVRNKRMEQHAFRPTNVNNMVDQVVLERYKILINELAAKHNMLPTSSRSAVNDKRMEQHAFRPTNVNNMVDQAVLERYKILINEFAAKHNMLPTSSRSAVNDKRMEQHAFRPTNVNNMAAQAMLARYKILINEVNKRVDNSKYQDKFKQNQEPSQSDRMDRVHYATIDTSDSEIDTSDSEIDISDLEIDTSDSRKQSIAYNR